MKSRATKELRNNTSALPPNAMGTAEDQFVNRQLQWRPCVSLRNSACCKQSPLSAERLGVQLQEAAPLSCNAGLGGCRIRRSRPSM